MQVQMSVTFKIPTKCLRFILNMSSITTLQTDIPFDGINRQKTESKTPFFGNKNINLKHEHENLRWWSEWLYLTEHLDLEH